MSPKKTVLILVAHSDDETLGMGGSIARHVDAGDRVYAISMTDSAGSRGHNSHAADIERLSAAKAAAREIKFEWLSGGNFPDNAMDTVGILEVVNKIKVVKRLVNPNNIYTHSCPGLNIYHQITSKAVLTAFRPQPSETDEEIRAFEVPSSTDYSCGAITGCYQPNLFIDISKTWSQKLKALNCYANEMRESPHARSMEGLENLARSRGKSDVKLAETFEIIRSIQR